MTGPNDPGPAAVEPRSELACRVQEAIDAPELRESIMSMAEASLADDETGRAALLEAAAHELDMLGALVSDLGGVEQAEELRSVLQSWYVSVRARWQVINARLQAQMAAHGITDMVLLTEGSLLTALVGIFEKECSAREIDELSVVLSDFDHAARTIAAHARGELVAARPGEVQFPPEELLDALHQPMETFLRARQLTDESVRELRPECNLEDVRDRLLRCLSELDEGVRALRGETVRLTTLPWASATDGLAQYGRDVLKDRAYRARLVVDAASGGLPGEGWVALTATARAVLDEIARVAFDPRDQRVAAGKPAFLTVRLSVAQRGTDDILAIEDDGTPVELRAALGPLPATVLVRPAEYGCRYEIVVPRRELPKPGNFVVARIDGHRLAIPSSYVSTVTGPARLTGGHVIWEDRIAPYADGASFLDHGAAGSRQRGASVILSLPSPTDEDAPPRLIALGVDGVDDVLTAQPLPVPPLIERQTPFLRGLIEDRNGAMVLVIDPPSLVAAR